jgi:hypothetical protein
MFTGPVMVGLEGFTGNPPATDPLGGISLNALSVSQGLQTDRLFVSDEQSTTWCYFAPTGSYVTDLTIRGTLYGPSGPYQDATGPTGASFTGPRGDPGAAGAAGATGSTGPQGVAGVSQELQERPGRVGRQGRRDPLVS